METPAEQPFSVTAGDKASCPKTQNSATRPHTASPENDTEPQLLVTTIKINVNI